MATEKLISQISTINRALGMIEGISYGMEQSAGQALVDAVQMIEETIKEMVEGGNYDNGKQIFYVKAEDIDKAPTVDAVEVVRCKDC